MKRRRVMLVIAGIALATVVAVLVWPGEREPEYQGKKLSGWIKQHPRFGLEEGVNTAISQMGTNAMPFLIAWIGAAKPTVSSKLEDLVYKRNMVGAWAWFRFRNKAAVRANEAAVAFAALKEQATPVIPQLMGLVRGTNQAAARVACRALEFTGTDAAMDALHVLAVEQAKQHNVFGELAPFLWARRADGSFCP